MITDTRVIMNIKQRITNLVNKAHAEKVAMDKNGLNWETFNKVQTELDNELGAIDRAAGKGLAVGRCLTFHVGDGCANYIITKILKNHVVVEWIPMGDHYFSDAVGLSANKRNYVVNRHTAERQCGFSDMTAHVPVWHPISHL